MTLNSTSFRPGHKHSPEVLEKIRLSKVGWRPTKEQVIRMVAGRACHRHSEETKRKISKANTGQIWTESRRIAHGLRLRGRIPWNKGASTRSRQHLNENNRRWVFTHKDRRTLQARQSHLKKRFGITLEIFDAMLTTQSNKCAICSVLFQSVDKKHVHIDHDHVNNRVRGLLCMNCNTGLGHFKDNADLLKKAIDYLEQQDDRGYHFTSWEQTLQDICA